MTHRASAEYKAFRAGAGAEGLLERPSDLRFWRPSSVGFLTRDDDDGSRGPVNFMDRGRHASPSSGTRQYIVVDELMPRPGRKDQILKQLHGLAREAKRRDQVLSFWVLHREDGEGLLVFARYEDKDEWARFECRDAVPAMWKGVYESVVDEGQRRTTWIESGLGFLGR